MAKKLWEVYGKADVTFYVLADSEEEAKDKVQQGKEISISYDNIEAYYDEANLVIEDDEGDVQ